MGFGVSTVKQNALQNKERDGVTIWSCRDGGTVQEGAFLERDLECGMFVAVS